MDFLIDFSINSLRIMLATNSVYQISGKLTKLDRKRWTDFPSRRLPRSGQSRSAPCSVKEVLQCRQTAAQLCRLWPSVLSAECTAEPPRAAGHSRGAQWWKLLVLSGSCCIDWPLMLSNAILLQHKHRSNTDNHMFALFWWIKASSRRSKHNNHTF